MHFDHSRQPDRLRRQVTVLNWFFERYRAHLDSRHVIRYEDLVESGGTVPFRLPDHEGAEPASLESRNRSALYDTDPVFEGRRASCAGRPARRASFRRCVGYSASRIL